MHAGGRGAAAAAFLSFTASALGCRGAPSMCWPRPGAIGHRVGCLFMHAEGGGLHLDKACAPAPSGSRERTSRSGLVVVRRMAATLSTSTAASRGSGRRRRFAQWSTAANAASRAFHCSSVRPRIADHGWGVFPVWEEAGRPARMLGAGLLLASRLAVYRICCRGGRRAAPRAEAGE
jgi:hypothetical protein